MVHAAPEAAQAEAWQVQSVQESERSLMAEHDDLREELAARILALTWQRIPPENVYADGRLADADMGVISFRLYRHGLLVVVRPCAYCGTGHFESPEISGLEDLGRALSSSAWRPMHEDCKDHDDYASDKKANY